MGISCGDGCVEGAVERGTTKVFSVSGEVEHGISSEGTERTMSMNVSHG